MPSPRPVPPPSQPPAKSNSEADRYPNTRTIGFLWFVGAFIFGAFSPVIGAMFLIGRSPLGVVIVVSGLLTALCMASIGCLMSIAADAAEAVIDLRDRSKT